MSKLDTNYSKHRITDPLMKGKRRVVDVTFNPTEIQSNEDLTVRLGTMPENHVLVPGSRKLTFEFENGNTESLLQENLQSTIFKHVTHKFNSEIYQDLENAHIIKCYEDLWDKERRKDKTQQGLGATTNLKKLMSGDDSGDATVVADKLMYDVYGKRFSIPIDDDVLTNHGGVYPHGLQKTHETTLRINTPPNVLVAPRTGKVVPESFKLKGLKLRYETIENSALSGEIMTKYTTGKSMPYKHCTLVKSFPVEANSVNIHETINLPRKSMRSIVLLFKRATDTSESYYYPKVNSCEISFQGDPNYIFSHPFQKHDFYEEASRVFYHGSELNKNVSEVGFFTNQFCLAIDLNTTKSDSYGQGLRLTDTQNGLQLQIAKSTGTTACICYLYVLSDALLNIVNSQLQSIQY